MARAKSVLITGEAMWDALSSPSRMEVFEFLIAAGPSSAAELAYRMDKPADSLYHHIKILLDAGLIVETGARRVGRQTEVIYDTVADDYRFDVDGKSTKNHAMLRKLIAAALRTTDRRMAKAFRKGGLVTEHGPTKSVWFRLEHAWLDAQELAAVNEHLAQVSKILKNGRNERHGTLFGCTLALFPVVRSRRSDPDFVPRTPTRVIKVKAGTARKRVYG